MNLTSFITGFFVQGFASGGGDTCSNCAGSVLSAITAALTTEGFFMQAEMLDQILGHGMQRWAILAYILSFMAGLVAVALGMPWKKYTWFVIGPALFYWLLDNRVETKGTAWVMGKAERPMSEVWNYAAPGLSQNRYVLRHGISINDESEPSRGAQVADAFAWYDNLISDFVQQIISMLGITKSVENPGSAVFSGYSFTADVKYQYLLAITGATIKNKKFEQMFFRFLESECGKLLLDNVDLRSMATLPHMKEMPLDMSVLKAYSGPGGSAAPPYISAGGKSPYRLAVDYINMSVPRAGIEELAPLIGSASTFTSGTVPTSFYTESRYADLMGSVGIQGVYLPAVAYRSETVETAGIPGTLSSLGSSSLVTTTVPLSERDEIACADYFGLIMLGLRWEAAHLKYQLVRQIPGDIPEDQFVSELFYGWDLGTFKTSSSLGGIVGGLVGLPTVGAAFDSGFDSVRKKAFLENLILVHLFRNSLSYSPYFFKERRYTAHEGIEKATQEYISKTGDKNRYGQVATVVQMYPHLQGLMLYLLALSYPFACMLIVVPGMHTALFTWMQYWAWVKLWDVGFAIVLLVDRSLWGLIGRQKGKGSMFSIVDSMALLNLNETTISTGSAASKALPVSVRIGKDLSAIGSSSSELENFYSNSIQLLDKLLVLSPNIDLDIANSYYLWIITSLLFMVPVAMGLFVLGSKSAIASMVSGAVGDIAKPGGSAAEKKALSDWTAGARSAQAVGRQEAYSVAQRGGLAAMALGKEAERMNIGQLEELNKRTGALAGNIKEAKEAQVEGVKQSADMIAFASAGGWKVLTGLAQAQNGGGGAAFKGRSGKPGNGTNIQGGLFDDAGVVVGGAALIKAWGHGATAEFAGAKSVAADSTGQMEQTAMKGSMLGSLADVSAKRFGNLAEFSANSAVKNFDMDFGGHNESTSSAMGNAPNLFTNFEKPVDRDAMALAGRSGSDAFTLASLQPQHAQANQFVDQAGQFYNSNILQNKHGLDSSQVVMSTAQQSKDITADISKQLDQKK